MSGITVVTGAGGFIGGALVADLRTAGHQVRAVDRKPLADWYQVHEGVENLVLDQQELDNCRVAVEGAGTVYNLAADMGGMVFIDSSNAL